MTPNKTQELNQNAANFDFLPFVVQLLSDKMPAKGVQPLPIGEPEQLTLEAIEAVQDISNQAVLAFLTKQHGWSKRAHIRYGEERPIESRIWEHAVWQRLSLSFSASTMDALLIAYNLTRQVPKASELRSDHLFAGASSQQTQDNSLEVAKRQGKSLKDLQVAIDKATQQSHKQLQELGFSRNGDLLLHHLVYTRLCKLQTLEQSAHTAFVNNPLNLLHQFHRCQELNDTHIASLERLLNPDIEPLLPWLSVSWSRRWVQLEDRRWNPNNAKIQPLDQFRRFNQNLAMLFAGWITFAQTKERPDLLIPLLDYYRLLLRKCGPTSQWLDKYQALTNGLRHIERTEYADLYAKAMLPALLLRTAYEDARELHPIEREAPHHLYMDHYQRNAGEETIATIEDFLHALQPTIG